jgi:site-specific DNA-methyltransferase (adenine-specific)
MKPYFERGGIVLYHGDCREILPTLDPASVDLVLTDPPYGIDLDTENRHRKRTALAMANDYAPVYGDAEPFDPAHLLRFPRLVLFGGNHFAERLPTSSSWLVWDKVANLRSDRALGFNDNADAELIWTNLGGPVRILRHQWIGLMKGTERGDARVHPTQKPVALLRWLIDLYSKPGDMILDPYVGSGTTLRAAIDQGRRAIGCEIEEAYCEIAARRCEQYVLFSEVVP